MAFEVSPRFKRVLSKKPPGMQAAVLEAIAQLEVDPQHPGLRVHKMQGLDDVWEAYVDKGNRITFDREGGNIRLRMNCNHDILNRNP